VPTPRAAFPASREEALPLAGEVGFPLVLKPADGAAPHEPGRTRLAFVASPAELLPSFDRSAAGGQAVLLEEYVPTEGGETWMFDGYFDAGSRCRAAFTGRKLRQYPPRTGPACFAASAESRDLVDLATRFLEGIGYRGAVDLDLRRDRRDGRFKVTDVNPRVGASFRLFVDPSGLDVARLLYLDLTGQPLPEVGTAVARTWVVEDWDLRAFAAYRREGSVGLVSWLGSLLGADEAAWFAADDLRPFLGMCRRLGRELVEAGRSREPAGQLAGR
jgi:predicted ATP-grasp superfamily ATP-dependent carboligase